MVNKSYSNISWALSIVFIIFGVFSTLTVTSGDAEGRVNLLYLVLLYVLLPLVSLLVLTLLALKNSTSWVDILAQFSIWPRQWRESLLELKREQLFSAWLFCQSQKLLLVFNLSCLGSFVIVLLFNDLSFVWRSTLLSAEHIFPFLNAIALPWTLIESAQPVYQLIANTQDSRLSQAINSGVDYGSWWKFLVVAQLVYGVMPRLVLFAIARWRFGQQLAKTLAGGDEQLTTLINRQPSQSALAPVIDQQLTLDNYALIEWVQLPQSLMAKVTQQLGKASETFTAGSQATLEQELIAQQDSRIKVVIVASWEPPLGELEDFLQQGHGYLMPLDWREDNFRQVSALHIDEWRRFCHPLQHWQLLQLKDLA